MDSLFLIGVVRQMLCTAVDDDLPGNNRLTVMNFHQVKSGLELPALDLYTLAAAVDSFRPRVKIFFSIN